MGRHSAADDSGVHPLVADALVRRAGAPAAAHGEHRGSSTGWPEPPHGSGGAVGWPDDTRPDQGGKTQEAVGGEADGEEPSALAAPRRGWWRLFGVRPAA
ncbi:hypothetical protein [Blastococcus goldschmidtiae]|uniref:Uncharacterized protein n=1 Tax=Blastococcus goldschmidtiae TaxID=3075546 RepID=A0ABU2K3T3_9ACTN|nr:hypothetical protein [Blastococcus sp. DSM 46792]MDT0274866.1 hypothetical protein [Blastococcus sp. DSM 46792]